MKPFQLFSHSGSGHAAMAEEALRQLSSSLAFTAQQQQQLSCYSSAAAAAQLLQLSCTSSAASCSNISPDSHAAVQPCSLAALQPCSHAALQPCSLAALQPSNLAGMQPPINSPAAVQAMISHAAKISNLAALGSSPETAPMNTFAA